MPRAIYSPKSVQNKQNIESLEGRADDLEGKFPVQAGDIGNGQVTAGKLATNNAIRDWVLSRLADTPDLAIGSFLYAAWTSILGSGNIVYGQTVSGVRLDPVGISNEGDMVVQSQSISGTWKCLGRSEQTLANDRFVATLWVRVV